MASASTQRLQCTFAFLRFYHHPVRIRSSASQVIPCVPKLSPLSSPPSPIHPSPRIVPTLLFDLSTLAPSHSFTPIAILLNSLPSCSLGCTRSHSSHPAYSGPYPASTTRAFIVTQGSLTRTLDRPYRTTPTKPGVLRSTTMLVHMSQYVDERSAATSTSSRQGHGKACCSQVQEGQDQLCFKGKPRHLDPRHAMASTPATTGTPPAATRPPRVLRSIILRSALCDTAKTTHVTSKGARARPKSSRPSLPRWMITLTLLQHIRKHRDDAPTVGFVVRVRGRPRPSETTSRRRFLSRKSTAPLEQPRPPTISSSHRSASKTKSNRKQALLLPHPMPPHHSLASLLARRKTRLPTLAVLRPGPRQICLMAFPRVLHPPP